MSTSWVDGGVNRDAVGQAELIRTEQVSPLEMVEATIERTERINPSLNAVIRSCFDSARASAAGPAPVNARFWGVPIVLKDTAMVLGEPVHLGMRVLRDSDWRAPVEDSFVTRLREAGFVVVGRTNTSELAGQATTEPMAYGPRANPWDPTRSPGGSSGGSAVAVAAGMVAVGHGNDGGGSIRIPASACGLVGLKPSRGRVSRFPLGELAGASAVEGMLCRSVRDAAALTAWLGRCDWFAFTPLWNLLGNPAMSVPTHHDQGLPIGVQMIADYGREDQLIRVASELEQVLQWRDRHPARCAWAFHERAVISPGVAPPVGG